MSSALPRVSLTVHNVVSLDGKISGEALAPPRATAYSKDYYRIDKEYLTPRTPVCIIGRNSIRSLDDMEAPANYPASDRTPGDRSDFHADLEANPAPPGNHYFVVMDPHGRLGWNRNTRYHKNFPFYNNDRLVEVLVEDWVTDNFLAQLRKVNVPYIFAGKSALDCRLAVDKLGALFKTDRVVCHGGGTINGAFLAQGVVDELSLVMVPALGGSSSAISVFNSMDGSPLPVTDFDLDNVEKLENGGLWLRYSKKAS